MWLKDRLRSVVMAMQNVTFFWIILQLPAVRRVLLERLGFINLYRIGLRRPHPYDRAHGTDTGGVVNSSDMPTSDDNTRTDHFYWGAPPRVVHVALAKLPSLKDFTFIDLGCGKGRPILVASEFPFQRILGVELSSSLARIAQANAELIARRYPERTRVEVIAVDAATFRLPPGNIVLYLYNPFDADIMQKVVAEIEAALVSESRDIYVIYQNPFSGHCFDASPVMRRYFAANLSYAWEERGFRPEVMDGVVIWQGGNPVQPLPGANAKIEAIRKGPRKRATVLET